jgi:hypothetical protein
MPSGAQSVYHIPECKGTREEMTKAQLTKVLTAFGLVVEGPESKDELTEALDYVLAAKEAK